MDFLKANFSTDEVLAILPMYAIDPKEMSITELKGIANNNYRVKGRGIDLVLKAYSHGQSDEQKITKEVEVIKQFGKNGLKVPEFISGKDGFILQKYKNFCVVATKFIQGQVFDQTTFTPSRMYAVGQITAKVEVLAKTLEVSGFESLNFREEFDFVSQNIEDVMREKKYIFDLSEYKQNQNFIDRVIKRLDSCDHKQFLHKDIWPWNLIDANDGIYLLDFNDWAIGDPIIEIAVPMVEFGMFKSDQFNAEVAKHILRGYSTVKQITFTANELFEAMLFICYLYFPYNVIQAEDPYESEIYLKRINTLLQSRGLIEKLLHE
jgi:Ser/Thr protein kinase RdoA (MazF antagonist)